MTTSTGLPSCVNPDFTLDRRYQNACRFWRARLTGQSLIPTPQHPDCRVAIVVPVKNEKFRRLERQIRSLQRQKGVRNEEYEVLFVVNNRPAAQEDKRTVANNQLLMKQITELKIPNVFLIDISSRGREIPECNVGRARNRGVAEASLRFFRNGFNGILLQTDADSYFTDPSHLSRLKEVMTPEADVVAIAGGLQFEFTPDTDDPEAVSAMRARLSLLELVQRWEYLEHWLNRILHGQGYDLTLHFSGAHMVSRSLETAVIGGLPDLPSGEDPAFGEALIRYANEHGLRVLDGRDDWLVATAARESVRTPSSFGRAFAELDPDVPPSGTDLTAMVRLIQGVEPKALPKIPINSRNYRRIESSIAQLPNGPAMLRRLDTMTKGLSATPPNLTLREQLMNGISRVFGTARSR